MRFVIGGHLVEGVTLPGLPGVTLGRNERVAWAFTNLYSDVEDLYRETIVDGQARRGAEWEKVVLRDETISVRGAAAERLVVRSTSHGPLVTRTLALKWVALDPANLRLPSSSVMRAGDPEAAFVKGAWDDALADLEAKNGKHVSRYRWGEANRLAVRHPLGRAPGLAAARHGRRPLN